MTEKNRKKADGWQGEPAKDLQGGDGCDNCGHSNPVCKCETDDIRRAELFSEFIDALTESDKVDEEDLRFMPLDGEDKEPVIVDTCSLESEQADLFLMDVDEAFTAISHGHPGFAIYFGRPDHGTEDVVAIDRDEPDDFPDDEVPETDLVVMSGSGTYPGHFYYTQDGSVRNAAPKNIGEVRASNYYCVVPGSIHNSGGIYNAVETGEPAEITSDDLPEILKPSKNKVEGPGGDKIEIPRDPPEGLENVEFENEIGMSLESVREKDDKLDQLLTRLQLPEYNGDRSAADAAAANHLWFWGFDRKQIGQILRRYRRYEKTERDDYLYDHTIPFATSGTQERITDYYDDEGNYSPDPTSLLPLERLDRMDYDEMHRYAKNRGLEWPDVQEVRDRLHESIIESIGNGDIVVKTAPTGAGKTYTVASEPWLDRPELTDGKPVIHLHETKKARDQAVADSEEAGVDYRVLKSGWERCPVARGDFDPENKHGNIAITIEGQPVSEWMYDRYRQQGVGFSVIHDWVRDKIDGELPCEYGDTRCPSESQWDGIPTNDEGVCEVDIIHATHQFLHVPSMRMHTNVFVDEKPDFTTGISHERFVNSINEYLDWVDIPVDNYHDLVYAAKNKADPKAEGEKKMQGVLVSEHNATFCETIDKALDGRRQKKECPECDGTGVPEVHRENEDGTQQDTLGDGDTKCNNCYGSGEVSVNSGQPSMEWYRDNPQVHTLAPAFTRAVWRSEESAAGRRRARIPYEPPRLDAHAHDSSVWNRVMVDVVLDENWNLATVAQTPDMTLARSLIGLDAHAAPEPPNWQIDLHPTIQTDPILTPTERTLYRRYERGLRTVQVGEGTQPMTTGKYLEKTQGDKLRVLIEHLRDHYGEEFKTAISSIAAEPKLQKWMEDAGVVDPQTMHYGEERGRNDFAGEKVGMVAGTISPNDDAILNMLARQGWDAEPEMKECPNCGGTGQVKTDGETEVCDVCGGDGEVREHGQGFVGEDADKAEALLKSVREGHVAQSAGRWARDAEDPEDNATVFIMTEAAPTGFIDQKTPGVTWTTNENQRERLEYVRDQPNGATVREIAEEFGCSKQAASHTLKKAEQKGLVERTPGAGPYGADVWSPGEGFSPYGSADVSAGIGSVAGTTKSDVLVTNTWSIAICGRPDRAWNCDGGDEVPWQHQSTFEWFEPVGDPPE